MVFEQRIVIMKIGDVQDLEKQEGGGLLGVLGLEV